MKTQSRIKLVGGVVSPLILFVSLLALPLAREGGTTAAMFSVDENTFEFTNDEGEDAYDLHIKWSRAVDVKEAEPFKKIDGSGKSSTDLSKGVVKPTGKASVKVAWDGSDPEVKEWWWTKKNGDRLGKVKTGNPATASALVTPSSTIREGLRIVTFDTLQGRVIVNLPDDMIAGDTISGTVMAEPKGQTPEERAKNMTVLSGYVIEVQPPKNPDGTSNPKVKAEVTASPPQLRITLPPSSTPTPPRTNVSSANSSRLGITLTNTSGSLSAGATTTVPIELVSLSLQSVAPLSTFQLPTMGQQGRPIVIAGPFDGNSSNTGLSYRSCVRAIDCAGSGSPWVQGSGLIVAESPRQAVFTAPTNVTGPMEIRVNEGTTETKAPYRNIGVNLNGKTDLIKDERTTLTFQAGGLQGITKPVQFTLESHGVIVMEGGPYQPLVIQPSQVGADGTFTTTRGITGVQTGVWGATATLVTHRFDVCLQDDSVPATVILVNTFSGDYIFTPSGGTSLSGTGTVTRKGCTITLTDSRPDRRVQGNIDPCTKTGSASVQTSPPNSPKIKFTITDRNTTNNTCTCGPGCK
ncbi:MAG TPA: hypothetical protein VGJ55_08325 [Pyrinomonadaceae bacterium]